MPYKGAEHIPTENILALTKNSIFNYEGIREKIGEYWSLSESGIPVLIERGLTNASLMITPQKLTEFARCTKFAIQLYNRDRTA